VHKNHSCAAAYNLFMYAVYYGVSLSPFTPPLTTLQTRSKNLPECPLHVPKSAVPKSAVSAFPKTGVFGRSPRGAVHPRLLLYSVQSLAAFVGCTLAGP
jgi:hypothetical protein